jgi:hypothetical protein
MMRAAALAFVLVVCGAAVAAAQPAAPAGAAEATDPAQPAMAGVQMRMKLCEDTVERHKKDLTFARGLALAFAIVTSAATALAGSLAAFVKTGTRQKVAGVCAAVGGVLTGVLPKMPDTDQAQKMVAVSDSHRVAGLKVLEQISLSSPDDKEFARWGAKYAVARFIDCTSEAPQPDVPPAIPPKQEEEAPAAVKKWFGTTSTRDLPAEIQKWLAPRINGPKTKDFGIQAFEPSAGRSKPEGG